MSYFKIIRRRHSDVKYIFHHVTVNKILIILIGTTGLSRFICHHLFIIRKMVMLKVISMAVLFLIRIRFPVDSSIAFISQSRYGNKLVKGVRKFQKIDYKLWKCKFIFVCLEMCLEKEIISTFSNFRVSNLRLKISVTYHVCQMQQPREEISVKKLKVRTLEKDFIMLERKWRETLGIIGSLIGSVNINTIAILKFCLTWAFKILKHHMTLIKAIFNYFSVLNECEKSLLC